MSNQVSGTSTNFTKLVAWDIDEYNGFSSEEDCLICLSSQERYLLRNVLRQMKWRTRWTSDLGTDYPDISTIAENLAYKLDEMNCIDFCQSIIDCINDPDSGVASSIQGLINAPAYDISRETGQSENDTVLGAGYNPTCDKDILYGQCRQIVEYMNQINIDILEIIEVASNTLDAFSQVAGDMKGIDGSAVATAIDWIAFIQDNIQENYLANVTVTYLDNLACDFFCAASLISCELTPQMMYDILSDRLSNSFNIESLFNETLGYLITGAWVGSEIPDFMFLSQLALRSQLGRIFQFSGYFDINTRMQIYANDPDPDWSILCGDCGWLYTCDFTADNCDWYAFENVSPCNDPNGVWVDGVGWQSTKQCAFSGFYENVVSILLDFTDSDVNKVSFTYNLTKGAWTGVSQTMVAIVIYKDGSVVGNTVINRSSAVDGDEQTLTYNFDENIDKVRLILRPSTALTLGGLTGDGVITSVQIRGSGTNPF